MNEPQSEIGRQPAAALLEQQAKRLEAEALRLRALAAVAKDWNNSLAEEALWSLAVRMR